MSAASLKRINSQRLNVTFTKNVEWVVLTLAVFVWLLLPQDRFYATGFQQFLFISS